MKETQCCLKCGIGFKQVGLLSQEERLEKHEKLSHMVECAECEDTFISHTHLRYHIETQHDATMPGVGTAAPSATGHVPYNMQ